MHSFLLLMVLFESWVIALEHAHPQVTSPPQKRDDPVATIDLGDLGTYQGTLNGVATPAGDSLIIYPTDASNIPNDGFYVLIGPDLQKNLYNSAKTDCADVTDQKCSDAVSKVLGQSNDSLVGRSLPVKAIGGKALGPTAAFFQALVFILTAKWLFASASNQPSPNYIHIPSPVAQQINSASAASGILYKTADSDPKPISVAATATVALSATGVSSGAASTSTTPSNCPADEVMPLCSECDGEDNICTTGDNKDCKCLEDRGPYFDWQIDPPDWLSTLQQIDMNLVSSRNSSNAEPQCDLNSQSQILYNLFNDGNGNTLYGTFCSTVNKNPSNQLGQVVDAHGNVIKPKHRRSALQMRTPPPDPDSENGYTFSLIWTGGDGSCDSDCNHSFDSIVASPCARLGGEQNDMANNASLDTGCGTYSYKIQGPPPNPPKPLICPDPSDKKNLAQNRCDQKCMGAGWERCDNGPDDYTCYCKAGGCSGDQCGDPVKIDNLTGSGTKCPQLNYGNQPLGQGACDIACPSGNYGNCGAGTLIPISGIQTVYQGCKCSDDPCGGATCIDRIHGQCNTVAC